MKTRKKTTWLYALVALMGLALSASPVLAHGDNEDPDHHKADKAGAEKISGKSAGETVTEVEHDNGTMNGPQDAYIKAIKFDQKLDSQVPMDATFRDEAGKTVQIGSYMKGKPVILVSVFFKCTMLCSEMLKETVRATKDLKFSAGQEFNVVALSIDERETPKIAAEAKAEYMKEYNRPGAEKSWHFLTGKEADIRRVTDSIGFHYKYDPKSDQFAHPNGIVVLTPHGKVARYFYGITYPPRDLKFGLMEASVDKIGSPVDQLLLMCFHYDPVTGKYGVLIMNVLRLVSAALVIFIIAGIAMAVRREKLRPVKKTAGASA